MGWLGMVRSVMGVKPDGEGDVDLTGVIGGGAVDSVNGQTGVVVLDAADVGAATKAYVDGRSTVLVRRVQQSLTNKTAFAGTGYEQVGSEEAVLDDAVLGVLTDVGVYACATGICLNPTSGTSLNMQMEISLDGGSTWSAGQILSLRDAAGSSATDAWPMSPAHQVTGTVTGDIQARLMVQCSSGASTAWDILNATIFMEVVAGNS